MARKTKGGKHAAPSRSSSMSEAGPPTKAAAQGARRAPGQRKR